MFLVFFRKTGFIGFVLLISLNPIRSQTPSLLRSTLGTGGASVSVHTDGTRVSFPQSIGQYGVTGFYYQRNLELRQGFIQPVLILKPINESEESILYVYPNPFSSLIFVQVNTELKWKFDLKIIDLAGRPVYSAIVPAKEIIQLDLDFLHKGIYILTIKSGKISTSHKIIKI
jgi:hypothetical protein